MRTREQILKKVRELEIKSKKLATELFSGEYHSAFKGKGMSFKEVREYAPGDDVRFIDWNVSARIGHPYSKIFEEERELTVMMLIDISSSELFGTSYGRKRDLAAELAAVLAFSAVANADKVGAIFFSDKIELYVPPKKGRQQALFIVREMLGLTPGGKGTNIGAAIRFFSNATKQGCIAFLLSDFLDKNYEDALRVAGKKHDVIGIRLYDRMDKELPNAGLIQLMDAETDATQWVDSSNAYVRRKYEEAFFQRTAYCAEVFKKANSDLLHLKTGDDYINVLRRFFKSRVKGGMK
ncbi:MAG: DUF58 domain-containing protein [Niabella sp.]|nr:DUF58 domain-containing protein [Niabella sp.]